MLSPWYTRIQDCEIWPQKTETS